MWNLSNIRNNKYSLNYSGYNFRSNIYSIYISLDIACSESISRCLKTVKEKGVQKIDILVNNAGVSNKNHPDDASTDVDRYIESSK